MSRLNLTPADLTYITDSMDRMKRALEEAANTLKTDTSHIQSKWNDDQFDKFKETMIMFHGSINNMAQQLENEKNRVKQYQSDTKQSADKFNNDFS